MKNTTSLKRDLFKEITIAFICIFLALATTVFGKSTEQNRVKPLESVTDTTATKPKKVLSIEEVKFYQDIEKFYQETFVKEDSKHTIYTFNKVVVYGATGEIILEQKDKIDLNLLPKGAAKLFVEGDTAYYLVF